MNSIQSAYNLWSQSYNHDINHTRDLDAQVTAQQLGQAHYASVLELGCGTGKNTRLLASLTQELTALDFSTGMLAQAQAAVTSNHVVFKQADLTQLWPCADQSAALIVANLVLEHVEDLDWIFYEARRCATPSGQFYVSELHPFWQYEGKQACFTSADGEEVKVQAYLHHVSAFLNSAQSHGWQLQHCGEWWHANDAGQPPRLISFLWRRES